MSLSPSSPFVSHRPNEAILDSSAIAPHLSDADARLLIAMLVMLAVLTKPDIRTDHVKLVDSFVDNERNRLISGDFKRQWAVPPIEVHRVVETVVGLSKPKHDLIPLERLPKYSLGSLARYACAIPVCVCLFPAV